MIYLPSLLLLVHFHSIFGFQRFIDDPGNVLSSPFVKPNNRRTVRDNNDKISSSLSDDSTIGDHEQELATPPTINIPQGSLVGSYETSRAGRTFASFKGIPYARVGQRFTVRMVSFQNAYLSPFLRLGSTKLVLITLCLIRIHYHLGHGKDEY